MNIRKETIAALNSEYLTDLFTFSMTPSQIVECAQAGMRSGLDIIDYQLTAQQIDKYGIKIKICEENPFQIQERKDLEQFIAISDKIIAHQQSAIVCDLLERLMEYINKKGTKVKLSQKYHKYLLRFKHITFKEAIIFEALSGCQVFYTMVKERRRSKKQYFMDPLINYFNQIKKKLEINYPFQENVISKRQIRYIQKKNNDKKMKNELLNAISRRNIEEVRELIDQGMNIEAPGIIYERQKKKQMNCSHRACQLGDNKMCRLLHSYKVNWQARDKEKMTPLHYAVQSDSFQVIKFLVEEVKVNLEAMDIQLRTPFYFACRQDGLEVMEYLYKNGCDINSRNKLGKSALSKASYLGYFKICQFLLKCPEIKIQILDSKQRTSLHNAAFGPEGRRKDYYLGDNKKDSPECTQLLLKYGANIDHPDEKLNTPLHVSASSDGIDSMRMLISYGASLTKLNCYGETALMSAAKFGHLNSIKMLHQQYKSSITLKDRFNKNLILFCTLFRQQDHKTLNEVFYYATDRLLAMAQINQPLEVTEYSITNWRQEINYTFDQLLKFYDRSDVEFQYFCMKCKELGIKISGITLTQVKQMFYLIKGQHRKQIIEIIQFILFDGSQTDKIVVDKVEWSQFVRWVLLENSIELLNYITLIQYKLSLLFVAEDKQTKLEFDPNLGDCLFQLIPNLNDKVLNDCLFKYNTNWIDHKDNQKGYNILHVLVRTKKLSSLIQVIKVLSMEKVQNLTNQYVIKLLRNDSLPIVLRRLLLEKDLEGFDPYNLALLLKDASSARVLEEKLDKDISMKETKFQVHEYSISIEEDPQLVDLYLKGFNLEQQLEQLIKWIKKCSNLKELAQNFAVAQNKQQNIFEPQTFHDIWTKCQDRKVNYIAYQNETIQLQQLDKYSVIGIDTEYFYCDGALVMSIMQISTIKEDYIIDFLASGRSDIQNYNFTEAVRKNFMGVCQNPKIMKLMHGCDNDLFVIRSVLKINFINFLDTARADMEICKIHNIRGLATLVKKYLGEHMNKDYQVSQWKNRPIPNSMIDYGRRDSFVLPFLAAAILSSLELETLKSVLIGGCLFARRNKKTNQPLIRSVQII